MNIAKDIKKILITEEEIQKRIRSLSQEIEKKYKGKNPLFICILRGAVLFLSDLIKSLDIRLSFDFMAVSSYGGTETESTGVVKILKDLETNIEGKDVIIVEDIVDTGLTIDALIKLLNTRKPKSIAVCSLLLKPSRRKIDVKIDYFGFEVPNEFVVGYGLDFNENYRNLPFIGVLKEEIYNKKEG